MANISNLDPKYLTQGINPQHVLNTFDEDGNLNMLVEIPTGEVNKYEYVVEANLLKLDRVNPARIPYPFDYGLIPQTWDEDNDLLDVMCLTSYPTFPGCLIAGRIIGICYFMDTGEVDDKVVVVPADDYHFANVKSLEDLPKSKIEEIEFYWNHYKDVILKLKGKTGKTEVTRWGNVDDAMKTIAECQKRYEEKFIN